MLEYLADRIEQLPAQLLFADRTNRCLELLQNLCGNLPSDLAAHQLERLPERCHVPRHVDQQISLCQGELGLDPPYKVALARARWPSDRNDRVLMRVGVQLRLKFRKDIPAHSQATAALLLIDRQLDVSCEEDRMFVV